MNNELFEALLNSTSLVQYQIDSYNRFLDMGLQRVVDAQGVIQPNVEGFALKLGKIKVEKPVIIESDSSKRAIFPNEAKMRDLTYAAPIYLEMVPIIRGIEKSVAFGDVYIGNLPVMVKSNICNIKNMPKSMLIENGEDPEDPGGYFIIRGSERVLIGVEDIAPNRIITTKERGGSVVKSRVFSTIFGFRYECTVTRSRSGIFTVDFPNTPKSLELSLLLKGLGLSNEEIINYAKDSLVFKNDLILNLEESDAKDMSEKEAITEIGRLSVPGQAKEYQQKIAETHIDNYLFPHIGKEAAVRLEKAKYLLQMARKASLVANNLIKQDDKDHYANKRVKFSGELMEELFAHAFKFFVREVQYQIERTTARGRKLSIQTIISPGVLTEKISYSMGTGSWPSGKTGISALLDKTNFVSMYANIRRVKSPLSKKHPNLKVREVHGTQYGKICASETPTGIEVGLTKYLAIGARPSVGADEGFVLKQIESLKVVKK
ncbi:MAG: DNA-directed RNA polymerase subunit B'' [Candidatus Micrarchaeaceae archaeon]